VTSTGTYVRVNPEGKVTKTFAIGQGLTYSGIDVLPSGNVLVPQYSMNKVVEYDSEGKSVWEANVQSPTSVQRLPDGKTLVASMNSQKLVELDRDGKTVWEQKTNGRPWRGLRR
jgi:streptogramin lyase